MNIVLLIVCVLFIYYVQYKVFHEKLNLFKNFDVKYSVCSTCFFIGVMFLLTYLLFVSGAVLFVKSKVEFSYLFVVKLVQVILVSPFIEEYIFRYLPCKFINKNNFISMVLLKQYFIYSFTIILIVINDFSVYEWNFTFYICYKGSNMVYSFISHSVYNMCVSILAYTNSYWYLVVSLVCFFNVLFLLLRKSNNFFF